ncbi:MAG TPA: MATE family efflux transporter [Bacillota bacterium]|nr:MATE family efflux transporter [Bacillota bacterium]
MSQSLEQKQYHKMIDTPISLLVLKLAVPTIISMLVTSVYNLADTYFVSQISTSASGAIGVVFSLMAIIQSIGFMLGMGAGSIISRALGAKNSERANRAAASSFFVALSCGVIIAVFGILFVKPFMTLLGATSTILPLATIYAQYVLIGAPIMMISFVLNNVLRAEGKAIFSMIGLGFGALLNIGLDPLCIFVFDMGIQGAAIATLIGQFISMILLAVPFIRKKSIITIRLKYISKELSMHLSIIQNGLPSFCRQGLASISTILLNTQAGRIAGDAGLSAMSIVSKISMLIFCIGLGIGQGYQPALGYNYGAKRWDRVRQAFIFTYLCSTFVMLVFAVASYIIAPTLIPVFRKDPEVIDIGVKALQYQALSMPFLTMNVMCNMTFQSLGHRFKATFLSCFRQGIYFIPAILILPAYLDVLGLELVQPLSDGLTCLTSLPFAIAFLKMVSREAKKSVATSELNAPPTLTDTH